LLLQVLIVGDSGLGKTTLVKTLLSTPGERLQVRAQHQLSIDSAAAATVLGAVPDADTAMVGVVYTGEQSVLQAAVAHGKKQSRSTCAELSLTGTHQKQGVVVYGVIGKNMDDSVLVLFVVLLLLLLLQVHDGTYTPADQFVKDPDSLCSTVTWKDEEDRVIWVYRIQVRHMAHVFYFFVTWGAEFYWFLLAGGAALAACSLVV
jgi:hypothetical protein